MTHLTETYMLRVAWVVLSLVVGGVLFRRYRDTGDGVDRHLALHFLVWGVLYYGALTVLFIQDIVPVESQTYSILFVLFYPMGILSIAYLWKAYNDISGIDYHHWFWGYVLVAGFLIGLGLSRLPMLTSQNGYVTLAYESLFNGATWFGLLLGTLVLAVAGFVSAYRNKSVWRQELVVGLASLSLFVSYFIPHLFDGMTGTVAGQAAKLLWFGMLLLVAFPERFF